MPWKPLDAKTGLSLQQDYRHTTETLFEHACKITCDDHFLLGLMQGDISVQDGTNLKQQLPVAVS